MAASNISNNHNLCHVCSPKQIMAITCCEGCGHHFCRKHFNEHRDKLSGDLDNIVAQHDEILQDLNTRIDCSSKSQLNDGDALNLLRQIDEWQTKTIKACCDAAEEARAKVKRLFDKTREYNALNKRVSSVATELKEQQQLENYVERDLHRWIEELKQIKSDIDQSTKIPTDIVVHTKDITWEKMIRISQLPNPNQINEHYVLVLGEKGVGKTTFIYYAANFFANKRSFNDRLSQSAIDTNYQQLIRNPHDHEQKTMFSQYSFPINDQLNLVFFEDSESNVNGDDNITKMDFSNVLKTKYFAAWIYMRDGNDFDCNELNDIKSEDIEDLNSMRDEYKQLAIVLTNCPSHALNYDTTKLKLPEYMSIYMMQNSAYQSNRTTSQTDSEKDNYHRSMETTEQILNKIIEGINGQG